MVSFHAPTIKFKLVFLWKRRGKFQIRPPPSQARKMSRFSDLAKGMLLKVTQFWRFPDEAISSSLAMPDFLAQDFFRLAARNL